MDGMIDDQGWLAEDSLPRFPVRLVTLPTGKTRKPPMVSDWPNAASTRYPWHAGDVPGVPMGWRSGVDLLDIDGEDAEAWLIEQIIAGRIPETRHHRTTRGYHLFFRYTPGFTNRTGIRPGVDFKTDEGFACWWPKRGKVFEDRPIAELPAVVRELLGGADDTRGAHSTLTDHLYMQTKAKAYAGGPHRSVENHIQHSGKGEWDLVEGGAGRAGDEESGVGEGVLVAGRHDCRGQHDALEGGTADDAGLQRERLLGRGWRETV
jgi:hypothetical protein